MKMQILFCACVVAASVFGARPLRVGAVNWDASVPGYTYFGTSVTNVLAPDKWRDRTPYYAMILGRDRIDYRYRTLAEFEREMQYAIEIRGALGKPSEIRGLRNPGQRVRRELRVPRRLWYTTWQMHCCGLLKCFKMTFNTGNRIDKMTKRCVGAIEK